MKSFVQHNMYYLAAILVLVAGILCAASVAFAGYGTPYGTPYSTPGPVCNMTWVWVPDESALPSGPCVTSTCTGESSATSGGGEGAQLAAWIDAVPRLVRAGDSSTLEWGSTGASSCTVTLAGNAVFSGLSGQEVVASILEQRTYVLECTMTAGGIETSSVTISIIPAWREF